MPIRLVLPLALLVLPPTAEAQQARQLLNGLRAEAGLAPVTPSPRLEEAAMVQALDMARNGFFGHQGSDGSTVGQRVRATGYGWCAVAENIAQGQGALPDVLGAWARSAEHRRNMLLPDVDDFGLVRAPGNLWVLVLGRDGC